MTPSKPHQAAQHYLSELKSGRKYTQKQAAELFKCYQPDVSKAVAAIRLNAIKDD